MDPQLQRLGMIAIFGLVAGYLAGVVVGHPKWGLLGSLAAGLLGAVVGGYVFSALKINFTLGNQIGDNLLQAVVGAAIVLIIAHIL